MIRTFIKDLKGQVGNSVRLCGWADRIRNQKQLFFIILRDHTGLVQLIHEKKSDQELTDIIISLNRESAIEVEGRVIDNPQVKLGGLEVVISKINITGASAEDIPIKADSALEHRLNWRFLDLRLLENYLIFKTQTVIEQAMREHWLNNGFIEIHSPKLMGSPSESGAELFELDYFGKKAYLAQSPQFYKQMAMAAGFDRVFEIGPVFRAEPSFTARHATEFTSVDIEMSWVNSHEEIMDFEEEWLCYIFQRVESQLSKEMRSLFGRELTIPKRPFPRIPLLEAKEIVEKSGHQLPGDKPDLDPEGERLLAKYVWEKFRHEFVFVTDYPIEIRPFYHMRHNNQPTLTKSFDLLWRGLEITTGAQREHRYDRLLAQAKEKGLTIEGIQYYLDFFRWGCPPHGGFGFGLTRFLMQMVGRKNIREVTYLYRGPNHLRP